jgi:hypothetical protein
MVCGPHGLLQDVVRQLLAARLPIEVVDRDPDLMLLHPMLPELCASATELLIAHPGVSLVGIGEKGVRGYVVEDGVSPERLIALVRDTVLRSAGGAR